MMVLQFKNSFNLRFAVDCYIFSLVTIDNWLFTLQMIKIKEVYFVVYFHFGLGDNHIIQESPLALSF